MKIPSLPSYAMPRLPAGTLHNRVDWQPDAGRCALLVHDMQDYFLSKYDRAAAPIPELIGNIAHLRALCHRAGIPVFYTAQQTVQPPAERGLQADFWGPGLTAPEHRHLQGIAAALRPADGDTVLVKRRYSAFQRSDLRERLHAAGRDQLIITGVYAHIGCLCTALEAFMLDVQPFFVTNATADFSLEQHLMAIRHVADCCGVSLDSDALMRALDTTGQTPRPRSGHATEAHHAG